MPITSVSIVLYNILHFQQNITRDDKRQGGKKSKNIKQLPEADSDMIIDSYFQIYF